MSPLDTGHFVVKNALIRDMEYDMFSALPIIQMYLILLFEVNIAFLALAVISA